MGLTIVFNGSTSDGDMQNVLSFDGPGAVLSNAQEIVDELETIWQTYFSPFQSDDYSWPTATVYASDQASGTPGLIITPTDGPRVGLEAAAMLPRGVSLLAAHSSIEGPPHRGRTFMPALTEASNTDRGLFISTTYDNFRQGFEEMQDITLADNSAVWLAIKSKGTDQVPANTLAKVNVTIARSNPAYQRRRRIGVGS